MKANQEMIVNGDIFQQNGFAFNKKEAKEHEVREDHPHATLVVWDEITRMYWEKEKED